MNPSVFGRGQNLTEVTGGGTTKTFEFACKWMS